MRQTGKSNRNLSSSGGTSYSRVLRRREVGRDEQRFRAAYRCDTGSGGSGSGNSNRQRLGQAVAVRALLTVHRSQGKEAAARSQPFLLFERGRCCERGRCPIPEPRWGGEAGKGGSGIALLTVHRCQGKRPPPVPSPFFCCVKRPPPVTHTVQFVV